MWSLLGFTFNEVRAIQPSASKVACCHFSSDGKLLATGGYDKKVIATIKLELYVSEVLSISSKNKVLSINVVG